MSDLSRKIRESVKQGRLMPALVIDIFFDKATVRLSTNGAIMRGLRVIGGPIKAGDSVNVDFTTPEPTVVAKSNEGLSTDDLSRALESLEQQGLSSVPKIEIMLFSGGAVIQTYPPSTDGLISAAGDANSGDVIWLPDVEIEADLVLDAGVCISGISSRQSIIKGQITLTDDCILENLKIVKTIIGTGSTTAVINNATIRSSFIRNSEIHAYNCSRGSAIAIQAATDSILTVENSLIVCDTAGTTSYAVEVATGAICKITHSRIYAGTEWFTGTGTIEVYANVDGSSELTFWCVIPSYENQFLSFDTTINADDVYLKRNPVDYATPVQTSIGADYQTWYTRFGNELYQIDSDNFPSSFAIEEWNIITDTTEKVNFTTTANEIGPQFCVIDYRKVLVSHGKYTAGDADHKLKISLVDFETETSSLYYEIDRWEDMGDGNIKRKNVPDTVNAVHNSSGDLIVVFSGCVAIENDTRIWLTYYGNTGYRYTIGRYCIAKNITQDGAWQLIEEFTTAPDPNYFLHGTFYNPDIGNSAHGQYFRISPQYPAICLNNKYIVSVLVDGGLTDIPSPPSFPAWSYSHVFNIETFELIIGVTYFGEGYEPALEQCVPDNENEVALLLARYYTDDQAIWAIDPTTGGYTELYALGDFGGVNQYKFLSSKEKAYLITYRNADSFDLHELYDHTELWINKTLPDAARAYSGYATVIDDNNRLWLFYQSLNLLKGRLIDNYSSDIIEQALTCWNADYSVRIMGDAFLIYGYAGSYFLRNTT